MGQPLTLRTELAETPASGDFLHVIDVSDTTDSPDGTSKKVQAQYLTISDASTTVKGKVELATDAETITGTDTVRAVTPANITAKIDTDGTLAGNLDTRIPSQKAVKTYVDDNGGADWKPYSSVTPTRASSDDSIHVITFAGVDLTSLISIGKKVKLSQTAGSNTQSLDLESGSSQYATRADTSSLSITGTISIEAWVKLESLGAQQAIVSKWNQDGSMKSYIFYVNSDNSLKLDYSGDSTNESACSSAVCLNNSDISSWVHVAVTLTPSTKAFSFYKNGVLVTSGTATGAQTSIADNASGFAIGCRDIGGTPDTFFDGKICEVRLWNTVRTQSQIQGNMFHNLAGNESGLAGYWKLDNAYTDGTANGNTLTGTGSPVFSSDVPAKLVNGTKYAFVHSNTYSTDTTVTLYTGTDYGIDDGTISLFSYSSMKSPTGFPLDPLKWGVYVTDTSSRLQASPVSGTVYNPGTVNVQIPVPIGLWRFGYEVNAYVNNDTATDTNNMSVSLSTANNSHSDVTMKSTIRNSGASGSWNMVIPARRERSLSVSVKTLYYLVCSVDASSVENIGFRGDVGNTNLFAVSAYL